MFSYRVYALFIIPGTVLLSLIKNFKAIAPTSLFANFCLLYSALVIFGNIGPSAQLTGAIATGIVSQFRIVLIVCHEQKIKVTTLQCPLPTPYLLVPLTFSTSSNSSSFFEQCM